jgi:hypothetical protein
LHFFQFGVARDRGEIAIPVPDRNSIFDCDGRDQAIRRGPDRDAAPPTLAEDIGGRNE